MKIRTGFVSNSSSSSFVVYKDKITPDQLNQIRNVAILAEEMDLYCWEDVEGWDVSETHETIHGFTIMDNFSFCDFFERIGLPRGSYEFDSDDF